MHALLRLLQRHASRSRLLVSCRFCHDIMLFALSSSQIPRDDIVIGGLSAGRTVQLFIRLLETKCLSKEPAQFFDTDVTRDRTIGDPTTSEFQ